ncbi:TPA: DUF1364 family protein [Enterobacter cloacae subsp. cloacae]|nr:DUF1364 family protein [Enterobacter cloacae subsp. cloacae]
MILPKDGIKLHRGNLGAITQHLKPLLESGKCFRLQLKDWHEKRSLSQNSLSHVWYKEISDYLIKSGRTDATPAWVKRNLKKTYLGYEEVEYTDFITGIKPPDLIATIACSSCHDEIDRRTRLVDAEYAKECALEGMARTQVIWLREGLVKI